MPHERDWFIMGKDGTGSHVLPAVEDRGRDTDIIIISIFLSRLTVIFKQLFEIGRKPSLHKTQ